MEKLDKVEIVREKTGVSYEEARAALEQSNYDVLDAIVLLEQQGKTQARTARHTTSASASPSADVSVSAEMARAQEEWKRRSRQTGFKDACARIVKVLTRLCKRGLEVSFAVERNGERVLTLPVLILAILILFLFPATIPLLVVGLFFGFRYRFEGLNTMHVDLNEVIDKAADGAESLKHDVMNNG